ncbi:MAG: hypothetical protein P8176_11050 [Gammaproteobacteria bacterium]
MSNKHTQEFQLRTMSTLILSTCLLLAGCGAGGADSQDAAQDTATVQTPLSLPGNSNTTSDTLATSAISEEQTTVSIAEAIEAEAIEAEESRATNNGNDPLPGDSTSSNNSNTADTVSPDTASDPSQSNVASNANVVVSVPNTPTAYVATIQWQAPDRRENGNELYLHEIAGYEVQYRSAGASAYTVVRVPEDDGSIEQTLSVKVDMNGNNGNLEVLIASYDNNGLYSQYRSVMVENQQDPVFANSF